MRKIILSLTLFTGLFFGFAQQYEPNWESLESRPYPQWFADAKLGIFIHWGLYSVPAYAGLEGYGEWYLKGLMSGDTNRVKFQNSVFGNGNSDFQYADFANYFKGELFRPNEWAALFKNSGAKYVVLVTKHHDGYCLWDSKFRPEWNSVASGPHRNIVSELTDAVRAEGLKMGFYYSLMEWNNPLHRWTVDPTDSVRRYVDEHLVPQFKELVGRYRPSLIFSDGDWDYSAEQLRSAELISWYYNLVGDEAVVNNRWGNGNPHGYRTPEYSAGITLTDRPWAECRGLGRSFGLNRNEPLSNYLTSDELIRHFCKLVAAGGGLTLNVGPAADGQIPLLQQERLLDLGNWLKINGEAIYGTRPFEHFYEMKRVVVKRHEEQINFNWKRNSPDPQIAYDNFDAEWIAVLTPSYTEEYTFEIETDDRVTLLIDHDTIINYDPAVAGSSREGVVKLKAHEAATLEVYFAEKDLEAVCVLRWHSKSQQREIVPSRALSGGPMAFYSCEQPRVCYTTKGNVLYAIALEFPEDELRLNVNDFVDATSVTLLGSEKSLPFRREGPWLVVDTRPIRYQDLKSTAAWVFAIH